MICVFCAEQEVDLNAVAVAVAVVVAVDRMHVEVVTVGFSGRSPISTPAAPAWMLKEPFPDVQALRAA